MNSREKMLVSAPPTYIMNWMVKWMHTIRKASEIMGRYSAPKEPEIGMVNMDPPPPLSREGEGEGVVVCPYVHDGGNVSSEEEAEEGVVVVISDISYCFGNYNLSTYTNAHTHIHTYNHHIASCCWNDG